jgi:hypothetical protein
LAVSITVGDQNRNYSEGGVGTVGTVVPNLDVVQTNFSVVLLFFW